MAKPGFASLAAPFAASSSSSRRPKPFRLELSPCPNRPPRSRPDPPRARILTLLAALSATPLSALAHPLDPPETSLPFLYPPFVLQPTAAFAKRSPPPDPATTTSAPSSHPSRRHRNLPDKYALAEDGHYHKTSWSLYGSCNGPCLPSPTGRNNEDDERGPSSPPFDDFDTSSLPTGWTAITIDSSSRRGTIVVLVLSVGLALVIIILMFALIFWRRKWQPKRDPERRRRRSSNNTDDIGVRSIREAKAAQRKWAKAAIRWRDNLRLSTRRRRTDRVIASATSYSTLAQEGAIVAPSSLSGSRPSSPTLTQRSETPIPDVRSSSMTSIHSSHSHTQTPQAVSSTDLPLPPSSPSPTHPPAYDPPPSPPESHASLENTYSNTSPSGMLKAPLSSHTQSQAPHGDDDGHISSLSGHVATDDKATLSFRAALASAPSGSTNFPQLVSVPSMEDVDTFEWPSESRPPSPGLDEYRYEPHPPYSPPTSLLPPPPSKGKQRFDYSHDLDIGANLDGTTVEPQLGPSAPPFEEYDEAPSAPPLELDVHAPSAPPMDSEDCPETAVDDLADVADVTP